MVGQGGPVAEVEIHKSSLSLHELKCSGDERRTDTRALTARNKRALF